MEALLSAVPYPPFVRTSDELANRAIGDLSRSLYSEVGNLQSCIALFDHGSALSHTLRENRQTDIVGGADNLDRDIRIVGNWPFIAAREALSAMYNFRWALEALDNEIQRSPVKGELPVPDGVREAHDVFKKQFDKAVLARHATSHRSEIRRKYEENAHKGTLSSGPIKKPKGASIMVSDCLFGRTFTGTRKGEMLKFDVTWETYDLVLGVYLKVLASVSR